jgi:hypothetical protein
MSRVTMDLLANARAVEAEAAVEVPEIIEEADVETPEDIEEPAVEGTTFGG